MLVVQYLEGENASFEVVNSLEDGERYLNTCCVPAQLLEVTIPAGYAADMAYEFIDGSIYDDCPDYPEITVLATNERKAS